jgi:transcription antitermination protein NusB
VSASRRPGLSPRERIDRSRARAWVLQILYRHESEDRVRPIEEVFDAVAGTRRIAPGRIPMIRHLLELLEERGSEVDQTISQFTRNWRLDRLSRIDRSILRIGTAEILFSDDVPGPVAIQEAVRLAERYGGNESSGFVNGVLDAVFRSCDSSS